MRAAAALLLLAACDQLFGIDPVPTRDATVIDTSDAGQQCIGGVLFDVCYDPATLPATLTGLAIDTSTNAQCTQVRDGTPPVCIVIAQSIDIEDTLRVVGPNPVAIVSASDLLIGSGGAIDVSSTGGGSILPGAGANTGACMTLGGDAQTISNNHAGGGAGGTFTGTGGDGGSGSMKIAAGQSGPLDESTLHGGCPGGNGGAGLGAPGATAGHGGGAVYLVAKGTIRVIGRVAANGERGYGASATTANAFPGGGGGGAGGMIVLDADMIVVDATAAIVANGGGGGGGASGLSVGRQGGDGTSFGAPGGTGGGSSTSAGGDGGSGSSKTRRDGGAGTAGGSLQGGGGGGGGAAGYIHIYGARSKNVSTSANVSPPES